MANRKLVFVCVRACVGVSIMYKFVVCAVSCMPHAAARMGLSAFTGHFLAYLLAGVMSSFDEQPRDIAGLGSEL